MRYKMTRIFGIVFMLCISVSISGQVDFQPAPGLPPDVAQTLGLRRALFDLDKSLNESKAAAAASAAKDDAARAMEQALTHMSNGIIVVSGWERSLILYHSLNLSTDALRKKDIRSRVEKIRDWGSGIGALVVAAGLF